MMGDFRANSDAIENISELHATSAGLKGICCERAALGIEDARKHAVALRMMYSRNRRSPADFKWRATAEGTRS